MTSPNTPLHTRLSEVIDVHLDKVAPAIQVVIHRGGVEEFNGFAGAIDQDHPVTENSLFDLASLTKLFTATAFLALASDSKVEIDQPIDAVIPEFGEISPREIGSVQDPHTEEPIVLAPDHLGESVAPRDVTFRHLLSHTSGLAPWRNLFRLGDAVFRAPPAAWPRMLEQIVSLPFADQVGANVHYSDLGFMLLGESVARLSGTTLQNAISQLVLEPLRLESILFNPLSHQRIANEIAPTEFDTRWRKYRCQGVVHDENAFAAGGVAGHAGLFGSASDVALFGQAWLDQLSPLPVAPEIRAEATTKQAASSTMRRGLGFLLWDDNPDFWCLPFSPSSYGHTGFTGTSLWIDPELDLVVACLTNRVYYGRDPLGIATLRTQLHKAIETELKEHG